MKPPQFISSPEETADVSAPRSPRLRSLVSDFLVYGSGNLLLKAMGFLLLPLYTRFLAPADYGILEAADLIIATLGVAVTLGQNHALERFYLEFEGERRRRLAGAAFALTTIASIIAALLLIGFAERLSLALLGEWNDRTFLVFAFVALRLPCHSLGMLALMAIRMRRERRRYLLLTLLASILDVALTLYLVAGCGWGVHGVLIGSLFSSLLQMAIGSLLLHREIRPALPESIPLWYGAGLLPATLILVLMRLLDRLLLALMTNVEELGYYGVAGRFAGFVWLAEASICVAWGPLLFRWHAARDHYRIRAAGTLSIWVFLAAAAFVSVVSVDLIPLMTPTRFHAAIPLVIGLSFAAAGNGAAWIGRAGIMIARRTAIASRIDAASLLVFALLSFILIPRYGALGASIAAGVSFWNSAILSCIISHRLAPETSADRPLLLLLLVAALGAAIVGLTGDSLIVRYGALVIFLIVSVASIGRSLTRRG